MKSSKQRRAEIRAKRMKKALDNKPAQAFCDNNPDSLAAMDRKHITLPKGAVAVDPKALVSASIFIQVPSYYLDKAFTCAACGKQDLWTAKAQKWWYEIAKGDIETTAKYCRPCRIQKREEKKQARLAHFKGMAEKHGIEKAAKILNIDSEEITSVLAQSDSGDGRT